MAKVISANLFFEKTDDGDMVYLEYYPSLERSKRIAMTREAWEKLSS